MRAGFTQALEQRLRCADPSARELAEVQVELQAARKRTRAEFETCDTLTQRSHDFGTGNVLDAVSETVSLTLANAPAGNALYATHYGVEIVPVVPGSGENVHEVQVALETRPDGAASWTERQVTIYRVIRRPGDAATPVAWVHEQMHARVSGLTSTAQVQLKVKAVTLPGGATFKVHGFNGATDKDPRLSSPPRVNITPAGSDNPAPVSGVTYHTGPALDFPNTGGAMLADLVQTKVSHGTSDGYLTDMQSPTGAGLVARVDWGGDDPPDLVLDRFVAHLHPKQNGANPKTVHTWACQPMAVSAWGDLITASTDPRVRCILTPLCDPVYVLAGEGVTAADVRFQFWDSVIPGPGGSFATQRPRPKAIRPRFMSEGGTQAYEEFERNPTTLFYVWGLQADGSLATNIGWAHDSGATVVTNGSRKLRTVEVSRAFGTEHTYLVEAPAHFGATARPVARCEVNTGSYANEKVQFSDAGNDFSFPSTPTGTVEFIGHVEVPAGTTCVTEVLKDSGAAGTDADWRAYTDGQVVGEIADVTLRQDYQLRARMTTNSPNGDLTPRVIELGVREVIRKPLHNVATVRRVSWSVDPITSRAEVAECEFAVLRDGERDYYDAITELLTAYDIGSLLFRLYVGDPDRPRAEWLHVDDFLIDDTEAGAAAIRVLGLSTLVLVRGTVPPWDDTTQDRPPKAYANQTPKAIWADLLTNQLGIAGRHQGVGLEDTSVLLSKTLTDHDGKQELDAVAHVAGAAAIASQGRIKAVDLYSPAGAVAHFGRSGVRFRSVTPGYRQRVPEYFVDWGYDATLERFSDTVRGFHQPAITKLGQGRIDPPRSLEQNVAQWITTLEHAQAIASRHLTSFGVGLMQLRCSTTLAYPELELGDRVTVDTDQFVGRDPNSGLAIRGLASVLATVVGIHNARGTEFTLWVRSYADILPLAGVGPRTRTEKQVVLGFGGFTPELSTQPWTVANVTPAGDAYARPAAVHATDPYRHLRHLRPADLPNGAKITAVEMRSYGGTVGGASPIRACELWARPIAGGTATALAQAFLTGGSDAWEVSDGASLTNNLPHVVDWAKYHYQVNVQLTAHASTVDNARFQWYRITWE